MFRQHAFTLRLTFGRAIGFLVSATLVPSTLGQDLPGPPSPNSGATGILLVEGQITDAMGIGGHGVSVSLHWKLPDGTRGNSLSTVTTNEYGDFQLRAREKVLGPVLVVFSKAGFAPLVHEVELSADGPVPFVAGELEGNLKVAGNVVDDATSQPVSDATVTLKSNSRDWTESTDAKGWFEIQAWSPGFGTLVVEAGGFGRESVDILTSAEGKTTIRPSRRVPLLAASGPQGTMPVPVPVRPDDDGPLVVRLKPERVVTCIAVDTEGKPLPAVVVEALIEPESDFRTAITDDQGKVVFKGIRFDATKLEARLTHDDYVASNAFDRHLEFAADAKEQTQQWVLIRAGRVKGTVVTGASKSAVYGARVIAGNEVSDDAPRDWTDEDGQFSIQGVPPGPLNLTVFQDGFATEMAAVTVEAGKNAEMTIVMQPAVTLEGVVRSESGAPIAGAQVEAGKWRGQKTLGLRAATDVNGRFVLENAPTDEFELVVWARGSTPTRRMVRALPGEAIEFKMASSGTDDPSGLVKIKVGDSVASLKLTTLEGEALHIPHRDGKWLLLDFWATWCGPCIGEVPNLVAVHERLSQRKDFQILGISLDSEEADLKSFLKNKKLPWPQVFGESAALAAEKFGVSAIPAIFLVSPSGEVVAANLFGPTMVETVERAMKNTEAPAAAEQK